MKQANASANRPVFVALAVLTAVLLFPVTSVFAYSHNERDDRGQLNGPYFTTKDAGGTWVAQPNDYNGYDYDTAIDCLEQYDSCRSPGTADAAAWYPYPNPYPYWMCPFTHIASYYGWSGSEAVYHTHAGGADSTSYMMQSEYLNAWYALPNGDFGANDYVKVVQGGGGNGSISADATDFHYNPLNAYDSSCH